MHTKESVISDIDELLVLIRKCSNSIFSLLVLPKPFAQKISELSMSCLELRKKVLAVEDDSEELLDLSKEFMDLEIWTKRRVAKNYLLPNIVGVNLFLALFFLVIIQFDFTKFASEVLGVESLEKLMSLGIAGAFIYLGTSLLANIPNRDGNKQLKSVIDFIVRLLLAVVVPVVTVVLFFEPGGGIGAFSITPELLSFSCGYSAKLVVDIFNKIIDKASKIIEAI